MAPTIPTSVPETIVPGDTVKFKRSYADYPTSEGWEAKLSLRGVTVFSDVTASVVDNEFLFSIPSTLVGSGNSTDELAAGTYHWDIFVSKAGERYTVERGTLGVAPNLLAATTYQAHAEKMLVIIEAALAGRLTADIENYSIAGRAVSKIPVRELKAMRAQYRHELWRLRNPGKLGPAIRTAFARAS